MRCPKCNGPIPIGGEVCRSCNYNYKTGQYEVIKQEPVPPTPAENRCPKCNCIIPAGKTVCSSCHYNYRTQRYERQEPAEKRCPKCNCIVSPGEDVCRNCRYNCRTQRYESEKPVPPAPKPPKKMPQFLKSVLSFVLLVVFCMAGRYIGRHIGLNLGSNLFQFGSEKTVQEETVNPAFDAKLAEYGLSYTPESTRMSQACFVTAGDYMVEVQEYRYSGDTIKTNIITTYISLSAFNAAEREDMKAEMKAVAEEEAASRTGTASYSEVGDYFVITITTENMSNDKVIEALTKAGLVERAPTGGLVDYVSMGDTAEYLVSQGYIRR